MATEIDFAWTYIGGAAEAVDDVVANLGIEAMPARIDHGITSDADGLNPPPV